MRILEKLYIDGFIVAMLGAVALGWLLPTSGHVPVPHTPSVTVSAAAGISDSRTTSGS